MPWPRCDAGDGFKTLETIVNQNWSGSESEGERFLLDRLWIIIILCRQNRGILRTAVRKRTRPFLLPRIGVWCWRREQLGGGRSDGAGKAVPRLLVSTLRVRPAAGQQPGRRTGFDTGLFLPAPGEKLSREGRPRPREVPDVPAPIVETLSGQRVEAGRPSQARRRYGVYFH